MPRVPGHALSAGDPGDQLPRPEYRRGPRPDRAGSLRLLPPSSPDPGPAPTVARHRIGLPQARPAGPDALGRRGAAAEAGELPGPIAGLAPPRHPCLTHPLP